MKRRKVKITKTVDDSQLPGEIRRMIDQSKNTLLYGLPERMGELVFHSLSSNGNEFFQSIDAIDSLRKDLADFDESLQEVQNILVGYRDILMPTPPESEGLEGYPESAEQEEGEYEKAMSQMAGADEVEYEEG